MNRWERVRRLAARQADMVTTTQAELGGIPARTWQAHARREAWPQPYRGVWSLRVGPLSYRAQLWAAVLSAGGDAALTGASRLWVAGAVARTPDRVDLWVPPDQGARSVGIIRVTRGPLKGDDAPEPVDGLPCLACVRAVIDLAGVASVDELVGVIAALDRLRITTYGTIARSAAGRGRFPGIATLRAAVELDGRPIAEIDLAWPRVRYGVEVDGPHHLLREVARADLARDRGLRSLGWWIDRFSVEDVDRTPRAFLNAVRRGLEQARARPLR